MTRAAASVAGTFALAAPAAAGWSAVVPAGREAAVVAALSWGMAVVSAVVWVAAVAMLVYCLRAGGSRANRLILLVGFVVPTGLLAAWLVRSRPHVEAVVGPSPADLSRGRTSPLRLEEAAEPAATVAGAAAAREEG